MQAIVFQMLCLCQHLTPFFLAILRLVLLSLASSVELETLNHEPKEYSDLPNLFVAVSAPSYPVMEKFITA